MHCLLLCQKNLCSPSSCYPEKFLLSFSVFLFSKQQTSSTAMAFLVVVSPLFRALSDKLRSLALEEVGLIWGVDQEMNKLADTLSTIQKVLHDAEEKQVTDQAIKEWLKELRALAFDAEDIMEEWEMDAPQLQLRTFWTSGFWRMLQVCSSSIFSCFCFEQISLRRRMAKRVNELEQKFEKIASNRSKFALTEGGVERPREHYQNRESSSFLSDRIVYGRVEERESVVGLLLSNADNENISVSHIVGMGGLGKTTLAQLCYNDPRVEDHFDVRIWVSVSDNFDVKRLTKDIIVSVSGQACDINQLDTLQRCLQEKLVRKRFLLVLDDVWDDDQEQWSRLESPLRCGAPGSAIMVTTRLKRVAEITGTCPPCFLKVLSEDECWLLFQQRAFGTGTEASSNLAEIGRAIVKKCGGVPLAAKVLGGLMRLKREENDWLIVRDSNIWDLRESNENSILPALRLSYTQLAPELKQCFAFCSVYPKDHKMEKEEVVRLWMANNLIQPKEGMQLEDIANEILGELCWRSFLEEAEKEFGQIHYTMHDLIHDLACSINVNECCYMDDSSQITNIPSNARHLSLTLTNIPRNTRHLSLTLPKSSLSILQIPHELRTRLRTLVIELCYPYFNGSTMFPDDFPLSCFISLRALSLGEGYRLGPKLIKSMVHLKHLRYLRLSKNHFESFPEALCKLKNLQTLELVNCRDLKKLPDRMGDMSCLRHLDIKGCSGLSEMPIELGKLTSLHTLSNFIVGPDYGRGIDELQGLDLLSGELEIRGLEHVKTLEDAEKANLRRKKKLTSLTLYWSDSADMDGGSPTDAIEGLQPHANIRNLSIHGYRGQKWFAHAFPSLKELVIRDCSELKSLPTSSLSLLESLYLSACNPLLLGSLDNLPRLSFLDISNFTHFPEEMLQHAPSLTTLAFWGCAIVQSLPEVGSSSLKHLRIHDCPDLTNVSHILRGKIALQELVIYGCPKAEISAVEYHHLKSLQNLEIKDIPDLESLPDGLRHLSSNLRVLSVRRWSALISLPDWIETFTNLESLQLQGCENLKHLPDGIQHLTNLQGFEFVTCQSLKSLPNGLQHLTNLAYLHIYNCHPELHGRCNEESGEHWPMIAHIPDIYNEPVYTI